MNSIFLLIAGMALVTYIPRMLPFLIFDGKKLSPFWEGVLQNIPYAALGALIFPQIILNQAVAWHGIAGGAAAIILSLLGANVIIVVLGSIGILAVLTVLL